MNHIFCLLTGLAHSWQVESAISNALNKCGLPTNYKVWLVTKNGFYFGYAFIWIEDGQAFNLLTGPSFRTLTYEYDAEQRDCIEKLPEEVNRELLYKRDQGSLIIILGELPESFSPILEKDIPPEWVNLGFIRANFMDVTMDYFLDDDEDIIFHNNHSPDDEMDDLVDSSIGG